MERADREKTEQEFQKLAREVVVAIAARAAMRALPVLASPPGFVYWSEDDRARHLQAFFCCHQASTFVSLLTEGQRGGIWGSATRAAFRATAKVSDAAYATSAADDASIDAACAAAAYSARTDVSAATRAAAARAAADAALAQDVDLARSMAPNFFRHFPVFYGSGRDFSIIHSAAGRPQPNGATPS